MHHSPSIRLTYRGLLPLALAYAALPLVIFALTWVRPLVGVPAAALVVLGWHRATRPRPRCRHAPAAVSFPSPARLVRGEPWSAALATPREARLSKPAFALIVAAMVAWCFLGGQGGMWYQSSDWGARNAIYRDLIMRPWPVYYLGGHAAMSYYIGHWLPPALVGNALYATGLPLDVVWPIANVLLWAWTSLGIVLVALLALVTLGAHDDRAAALAVLMLVFFSTPDVIGLTLSHQWPRALAKLHLEQWARAGSVSVGQYSSITTCLFWVFNQAVIPWVCTVCFLNEEDFRSYLLLWSCCLFSGPLPSVGLAALMAMHGIAVLVGTSHNGANPAGLLRGVLSPQNAVALVWLPLAASFFFINSAMGAGAAVQAKGNLLPAPLWLPSSFKTLKYLVAFIAVEGLLLPALLWFSGCRRRPLLAYVATSLALCPFIRVGIGTDFCMRASIPAILCLYVLCAREALSWGEEGMPRSLWPYALVACLALGAVTPAFEFCRGFQSVVDKGVAASLCDQWSISTSQDFSLTNFALRHPEITFFYHWLARMRV